MKSIVLLFLCILLTPGFISAQDIPILFSVTQEDYEVLENPISVNNGDIWGPDDVYTLYFNFDFQINGHIYTALLVNAGIGLTFSGYNSPKLWIWASEWGGWPFLFDRGTNESESPIDYEIVGDEGSRILKIQWQNAGIRDNEGDDPNDFVDFQMWVYEGTNRLEVHYGPSQTSGLSFGYNDGPGVRFWNIEDDWGICVYGYADMPSWDWVLFDGPYPGCLLDSVPSEDIVYNFYPNPTVSINEISNNEKVKFKVIYKRRLNELKVHLNEFEYGKTYTLSVYNSLGIKQYEVILDNKDTYLHSQQYKKGLYIFILNDQNNITTQKCILN
ncbi:MAG: T9SS type A sorting domain-containing protein [Chlorobi bacterium]|nr:T9SS type A sorting domain-containing protein [Chlorobiota bacterium]